MLRSVFVVDQTNKTAYLRNILGSSTPTLISIIKSAYSIDSHSLNDNYDVITQIYTELNF